MSHGPSTLGTMMTSRRSPISVISRVRSSNAQGDSSALTRVHSAVSPSSSSRPTRTSPSRAASLFSTAITSSRLPSRMSVAGASSGSLATTRSLDGSKKWIMRDGLTGISGTGAGAPMASGLAKSRGLRMSGSLGGFFQLAHAQPGDVGADQEHYGQQHGLDLAGLEAEAQVHGQRGHERDDHDQQVVHGAQRAQRQLDAPAPRAGAQVQDDLERSDHAGQREGHPPQGGELAVDRSHQAHQAGEEEVHGHAVSVPGGWTRGRRAAHRPPEPEQQERDRGDRLVEGLQIGGGGPDWHEARDYPNARAHMSAAGLRPRRPASRRRTRHPSGPPTADREIHQST